MPEGAELLHLGSDFPAVSTSEWESAIQRDLKGADHDKKLLWRTDDGISVRPYYRAANSQQLGELADLAPGEFPFTRGTGQAWEEAQDWTPHANAIRGDAIHELGGTAVQELAFSIAEAVENLQVAIDSGKGVEIAAPATVFVFAVGSSYFIEIAKLRAARLLWSTVVQAFGCQDVAAAVARIHVRTARVNKSLLDPYTNLLRVTTEAMSAVIGGCDSLTVEAFGFDPHLALNVQRILLEEAQLARVADVAGGSYYIEALTDALAREAWKLFQQAESAGGWTAALRSGFVEYQVTASRQKKIDALALRRKSMVGVNNYPSLAAPPMDDFAPSETPAGRLAGPFERIRLRTEQHVRRTGHRPKVLLLKRGDLKMKMARANFCLNFFGCAGFDIVESEECAGTDADLIVLCSSDSEYIPFARQVCPTVEVPVIVAGNPKDQMPQLGSIGVHGFVHASSNAVEVLTDWQDRLGAGE